MDILVKFLIIIGGMVLFAVILAWGTLDDEFNNELWDAEMKKYHKHEV